MAIPLESAVVGRITRMLDKRGAWWVKSTGVRLVGCPDLLVCYRGHFLALEVKRHRDGKYQATKKQLHELTKIGNAGGIGGVVYGVEDVEYMLKVIDARVGSVPDAPPA